MWVRSTTSPIWVQTKSTYQELGFFDCDDDPDEPCPICGKAAWQHCMH